MTDPYNEVPYSAGVPHSAEPQPAPRRSPPASSTGTIPRLIWLLAILLVLLIVPPLVWRIQYAITYGQERARVDVAMEGLEQLDERLTLSAISTAFQLVAQKVSPSVVHIQTARVVDGRFAGDEWSHLFGPRRPEATGQGSGVIVDEAGYIVTNNHVIAGATAITVQLPDGRRVVGHVVGSDPLTDIAVLKISADKLIATPWGDSEQLQAGDLVWAVGSPFGLERTVTFGIVSAKGRRRITNSPHQDFLQTDAAVNPGNSGGPLVNMRGQVIGINTAIVGRSYQGISFAIPSAIAEDVYVRLKETGKVARGWLGVALEELTAEQEEQLGLQDVGGVRVDKLVTGSPAQQAGIQPGDVIIEWNGQRADEPTNLSRLVAATEVGSVAEVKLLRNGEMMTLEVTVDERPQQW